MLQFEEISSKRLAGILVRSKEVLLRKGDIFSAEKMMPLGVEGQRCNETKRNRQERQVHRSGCCDRGQHNKQRT